MEFYIGQIFEGEYPPEAAEWCNGGGVAHIEEVTPEGSEIRQFQIVENPPPPETKIVRTFSKFSIWVATRELPLHEGSQLTVWQAFEDFLKEAQLWTGWNQLVDLVEDNPFFEQFFPLAVEQFGKELVDRVLDVSVVSTKTVIM
jgi:hypothetical protein